MGRIFLLWMLPALLLARDIRGTVTSAVGQPLSDVHVLWIGTSIGAVTDAQGLFSIRVAEAGTAVLRFTSIGYATQEHAAGAEELHVVLHPTVLLLQNGVTISARRFEQPAMQTGDAISVLTASDIRRQVPRTTPDLLAGAPGVWLQKTNHGGGSPIVRGLVGNQVLLMTDGIRINNSTYRYGPNQYLSTLDPYAIERLEIVRGNGSVQYGSDAMGGVVQALTKTPAFSTGGFRHQAHAGIVWMSAAMEQTAHAEWMGSSERVAFYVNFTSSDFGDLVAGRGIGTQAPSGYSQRTGSGKLLFRLGDAGVLTLAHQQVAQHKVPRFDQVAQGGFRTYYFDPQDRQLSYLRLEQATTNKWIGTVRATASFQQTHEGVVSQRVNAMTTRWNDDRVGTVGFQAEAESRPRNNWRAVHGVEVYADQVSSKAFQIDPNQSIATAIRGLYADGSTWQSTAVFSSHQYDGHKLSLTGGARFNHFRVSVNENLFPNTTVNPSAWVGHAGAQWKVTPTWRWAAYVSSSFRAPNIDDMSKLGPVESTVFEIPSGGLRPERARTFESGMKKAGKTWNASFTGFYTRIQDQIDRVPALYKGLPTAENRAVYQKQNIGQSEIYGWEFQGEWSLLPPILLSVHATYTYGHNLSRMEPMRRIPPLFGAAALTWRPHERLWMKCEGLFAEAQDRLAAGDRSDARIAVRLIDGQMPAWRVVNVYAGWSGNKVGLQLVALNVFDSAYRVYGSGVDSVGRSLRLSIIASIN